MKITCPCCNQIFDMADDVAAHIIEQIRTQEFEKELASRISLVESKYKAEAKSKEAEIILSEQNKSKKEIQDLMLKISDAEAALKASELRSDMAVEKAKLETREQFLSEISDIEAKLKAAECELEYYKDLKSRMSTKMIGETLEQHCELEFNKIRMAAFPKAEFSKDNKISRDSGSKGDYVFREYDENGIEIISIMFEMKNETDTNSVKKKNEHFFKELDKDRHEKNCEYAVLVSLLEPDNELYNQGIVDISYQYDKMYVIRPQFFIPIITLLRNAALRSLDSKRQLAEIENQNLDIKQFRDSFETFKNGFNYNYTQAGKRLMEAVDDIDKTIKKLESIKSSLLASDKQLSLANRKIDDMTVDELCKNSPSLIQQLHDSD